MKAFQHISAKNSGQVASLLARYGKRAKVVAGGMDLLGELKYRTVTPELVIDLKTIPKMSYIRADTTGLKIGATTILREIAENKAVKERFLVLAQAAESVATPQIRNFGTLGGNICQRPRCWYYRSIDFNCLKKGGPVCYAKEGENQYHCILGGDPCYIVHPSDTAPALMALGAKARIMGKKGERTVPFDDFFILPAKNVLKENVLEAEEFLTEVQIPNPAPGTKSIYLKSAERRSWDFALASVALVLRSEGGIVREARVVLGGVAPIPWRAKEAEGELKGRRVTEELALRAAEAAVAKAKPLAMNAYKVDLTKALVRRAVLALA